MGGLRTIGRWSLVTLAWLITAALGLADLFSLRSGILRILVARGLNPYQLSAADKWTLLPLGMLWLGTVLYSQYYYGGAALIGLGVLGSRWLKITLIQMVIFLLGSAASILV